MMCSQRSASARHQVSSARRRIVPSQAISVIPTLTRSSLPLRGARRLGLCPQMAGTSRETRQRSGQRSARPDRVRRTVCPRPIGPGLGLP